MIATVWTQPGCPACEREKALLLAWGYEIEERDAGEIESGRDDDIRAAFAEQNDEFPLVRIGGEFKLKCQEW